MKKNGKLVRLPDHSKESATLRVWRHLNSMTVATTKKEYSFNYAHLLFKFAEAFMVINELPRAPLDCRENASRFVKTYCTSVLTGWKLRPESVLLHSGLTLAEDRCDMIDSQLPKTVVDTEAACPPLKPLKPEPSPKSMREAAECAYAETLRRRIRNAMIDVPRDFRTKAWELAVRWFVVPT